MLRLRLRPSRAGGSSSHPAIAFVRIALLVQCFFFFLQYQHHPVVVFGKEEKSRFWSSSHHDSNFAVIVSSSRYWFNYRHVVNALSIYKLCKENGIPDSNILLMLADEIPVNPRNPYKNGMYPNGVVLLDDDSSSRDDNLYDPSNIEIDYRGDDVTIENMIHSLLGKHEPPSYHNSSRTPPTIRGRNDFASRLTSTSNLLIYWTGHGGDQFFKFQDIEEIMSEQWYSILKELHLRNMYHEILFMADTCQAYTLGDTIIASNKDTNDDNNPFESLFTTNPILKVPNVYVIGSSLRDENSYAHHSDTQLGLSVIERYTHNVMEWIKKINTNTKNSNRRPPSSSALQLLSPNLHSNNYKLTLQQALIDPYSNTQRNNNNGYSILRAHVGSNDELCERKFNEALFLDFFGNQPTIQQILQQQKTDNTKDRSIDTFIIIDSHKDDDNTNENTFVFEFPKKTANNLPSSSSHDDDDNNKDTDKETANATSNDPINNGTPKHTPIEPNDWRFRFLVFLFLAFVYSTSKYF